VSLATLNIDMLLAHQRYATLLNWWAKDEYQFEAQPQTGKWHFLSIILLCIEPLTENMANYVR
jgi:hypothetical protein